MFCFMHLCNVTTTSESHLTSHVALKAEPESDNTEETLWLIFYGI